MNAASRPNPGAALTLVAALLGGCNAPGDGGAGVDAAVGGLRDSFVAADGGADLADPIRCHEDGEGDACQDDTFCRCASDRGDGGACGEGTCLPWRGADPDHDVTCHGGPFPEAALRTPSVACRWRSPQGRSDVISTPLVIDLDGDLRPEIVFQTATDLVVAIRGNDCSEVWRVEMQTGPAAQPAAADLDGDGRVEVLVAGGGALTLLDYRGRYITSVPVSAAGSGDAVAIADVDGVAPAEVAFGAAVFRYVRGNLDELWSHKAQGGAWGIVPQFADLDGDRLPELIVGTSVFDGRTGADETPLVLAQLGAPGGYAAVADFNRDGKPDLAVVQSGPAPQRVTYSILDLANDRALLGPHTFPQTLYGGPPTIADFDGDGVPDMGFAAGGNYNAIALRCAVEPIPADCNGSQPGMLWQRQSHDGSGATTAAAFDFNGDGVVELAFRDECWLRVMSGPTGRSLFAMPVLSGTAVESTVVADVDSDGHADLVVSSDTYMNACTQVPEGQLPGKWVGPTDGVFVLRDPQDRWMASRPLWHQHAYHVNDIKDDRTVPLRESPSWLDHNSYRRNVQGRSLRPNAQPDLTAAAVAPVDNGGLDCAVSERLWASICNRGASSVPAGVRGAFYDRDPRLGAAAPLCTVTTAAPIAPGSCETVTCDRPAPPAGPQDLWFRANDDGAAPTPRPECKPLNNVLALPGYTCKQIQ